jgi:hypothetical protein
MGLSRIDESEWLLADGLRDEQVALKAQLLAERRDDVLAILPDLDTTPACDELLRMWGGNGRHGARFSPEFEGTLEQAALSVQEDLCILQPDAHGRLVLAAACVCFPSHWRLADKIGRPAADIHGPVPRYGGELERKVDTFLDRLRPDAVMQRRNWLIHETADLFVPDPPADADLSIPPEALWLRSERQTLRRLPHSGAVVFTIRTQQIQMSALRHRPDLAAALADRIEAQPDDLARYAAYRPHVPALIRRLNSWAGRSEQRERRGRE